MRAATLAAGGLDFQVARLQPIVQIDQARFGFSQEMHATLLACYEENKLEEL